MTFVPRFKAGFRYLTKEDEPRSVRVLGRSGIDPDVFDCYVEGMAGVRWLMNCSSRYDGRIIGTEIYLDETTETEVPLAKDEERHG